MTNRFFFAIALSLVVSGAALAADKAAAPAANSDPVVARINGEAVNRSEVLLMYSRLPQQMRQLPPEQLFPILVDQVIEQKLVAAAGYKAGLQSSEEVKSAVKKAEELAVQHAYLRQAVEKQMTEEKVLNAYKKFVADFKPQDEVKAAHILVSTEDEAKAIIAQLDKGADFAVLAKEKSKDTGSAEHGGDLGYFPADAMVEPFAKAAFALKKGETTKAPVQTTYGWHVIKVEDRRLSPVPSLAEERQQIEQKMSAEIVETVVKGLKAGVKIETFNPDGSPVVADKDKEKADKPAKKKK